MLGLPLMVMLTTASQAGPDPKAATNPSVELAGPTSETVDPQVRWAERVIPLLLARPAVQVVFWNQLTDAVPHEFPNGGLFDADGNSKPALGLMRQLRKSCLV